MPEATDSLWVRCQQCGHTWAAAFYPMELMKFARALKANTRVCPRCAASPSAVMANPPANTSSATGGAPPPDRG
jgi:ribosomal protein S27AE